MDNITDNISIMRQQINELYRIVGRANLYISKMDNKKVNVLKLNTKIEAIHEILGLIENELNHFL